MTFRPSNVPTLLALTAVAVLAVAACGGGDSLGPPTPTGATDIGGPPMTSAPPPPPGWNPKDVVPQSQQQAQDTVTGYLTRILQALPPGTVLDGSRYAGAGHNSSCEDEPLGPGKPPMRFHTIGELTFPQGVDQVAMIQQLEISGAAGAGMSLSAKVSRSPINSAMAPMATACKLKRRTRPAIRRRSRRHPPASRANSRTMTFLFRNHSPVDNPSPAANSSRDRAVPHHTSRQVRKVYNDLVGSPCVCIFAIILWHNGI